MFSALRPVVASTHPLQPSAAGPGVGVMALVLAPLVAVAGGRWGSYIGIVGANVFIADLLVLVGLFALLLGRRSLGAGRADTAQAALLTIGLVYVLVSLAFGQGPLPLRLRDLAPFLYLGAVPGIAYAYSTIGAQRSLRYLRRALLVHLSWALPATLGVLSPLVLPSAVFGAPVFSLRNDFDGVISGVGVVLVLACRAQGLATGRGSRFLVYGGAVQVALQTSRAAALAIFGLLLIYIMSSKPWRRYPVGAPLVACGATVVACLVSFLLLASSIRLPSVGVIERLGLGGSAGAESAVAAQGTQNARIQAWKLMIQHTEDEGAELLGTGPGSQPVAESGAVRYLSGAASVRAPHSWPVAAFSYFGVVGLTIWTLLLSGWLIFGRRRSALGDPAARGALNAVAYSLIAGLLSASLVGVIIESPFGLYGLVLGLALLGRSTEPSEGGTRL